MVDSVVLRIVSSNNVEIFRHLGAAQLKRARIEHLVGSDIGELRALIADKAPNLVLVDAVLADGSGYDLCREIKADPRCKETHVIILHSSVMSMDEITKSAHSGCDDVLALPLHADDFYCHLAQVTGVSLRDSLRVGVDMEVRLRVDEQSSAGTVTNLGSTGLGVQLNSELPLGPVAVAIVHEGTTFDGIAGEIVWCNSNQRGYAAGLRLVQVPSLARGLLARLSLFHITDNKQGDGITVAMQGIFDEQTDFRPLLTSLEGERYIDFMMQGVTYLSSSGVRAWCLFLNALNPETAYSFRNCSLPFASQASMVPMTIGRGSVVSLQAPYLCEKCDREETRLVETALVKRTDGSLLPPALHCHVCASALLFDDLPERYFAFLND